MTKGVTGIILAGGQSRRMGQDKAFLPWGDATLLEYVIATLRPITDELIVAVNDPRRFQHLPIRVVEDVVPDAHALGGIYTGVGVASNLTCFVCGCDAPFLSPVVIRFLIQQANGWDLVIPRTRDGLQPLHAVYAKAALPAMEDQLRHQRWDLQGLVSRLRTKVVEADVLRRLDPRELSCFNVNTPEDYLLARHLVDSEHAADVTRSL